ncbi:chymotrypsin-1-like [Homalodisca vitripennis]|uniref:chymotrypsin-1-like n=1 Tax=Homalodisca vitripennis TaxID=197043 RepID=UPI001EEC027B|nr:chymotrypsin-1-like [Homalodisca vitripennis]
MRTTGGFHGLKMALPFEDHWLSSRNQCAGFKDFASCLARGLQIRKHPRANIISSNNKKSSLGIINGKSTSIQKCPFMVAILMDNELFTSGVILNSHWILTTAYSVYWSNSTKLSFRIGSTESDEGSQIFTVDHVVTNKNYTGSWDNDIAVIKLNKPIKFGKNAKPIKLRTKNLKSGTKGLIASEESSPVLLDTKVTVYDWEKCQNIYPDDVTPRQICTYDTKTGPCVFVWGDPLVYKGALYGLLTGISECLSYPVVYTDVPAYLDWIKSAIKE